MGNFDEYFPFDPGYGAAANAARWRKMANLWQSDGVVANYPYGAAANVSQLFATPISGGQTQIQQGAVFVHGYYAEIQTPQTISVGTNGSIVAQVNFNTEVVALVYRDGVLDYGSNPANNYEQDANIWEIPVWLVSSGALVDIRTLINPAQGLRWWAQSAGVQPIAANGTLQNSFGTARIPYVAQAFLHGVLLLTFTDLSQAQTATCTLTYQCGRSRWATAIPTGELDRTGAGDPGPEDLRVARGGGARPRHPGVHHVHVHIHWWNSGSRINEQPDRELFSLRHRAWRHSYAGSLAPDGTPVPVVRHHPRLRQPVQRHHLQRDPDHQSWGCVGGRVLWRDHHGAHGEQRRSRPRAVRAAGGPGGEDHRVLLPARCHHAEPTRPAQRRYLRDPAVLRLLCYGLHRRAPVRHSDI